MVVLEGLEIVVLGGEWEGEQDWKEEFCHSAKWVFSCQRGQLAYANEFGETFEKDDSSLAVFRGGLDCR